MCHLSPTVHLAWAVLSCGLQINLIQHLWRYDRFKCLRWSSVRQPGTFKRVMTYSYCASVPLLLLYSVSMAVLKYRHGYTMIPGHGIVPTPYQLWPKSDREWLTPLYLVFSVVWGLELVTHMEELTFWLFLLHQGPTRREWFSSIEFRIWAATSVLSVCGMPLAAIFDRSDPLQAEAYIFLAGSLASTCITAVFFIVLFKFPAFLRRVKKEGAAGPVVLRLVKFHELNVMRIIFRLLFTVPLLVLGIDGVSKEHKLNESALWSDLLAFVAAFGTVISSSLTLLIFFPRSLAEDSNWRPLTLETPSHETHTSPSNSRSGHIRLGVTASQSESRTLFAVAQDNLTPPSASSRTMLLKGKANYYSDRITSPTTLTTQNNPSSMQSDQEFQRHTVRIWEGQGGGGNVDKDTAQVWRGSDSATALTHDTKQTYAEELDGIEDRQYSTRRNMDEGLKVRMMELSQAVDAGLKKPTRPPRLHPYITSFTSPIDLLHNDETMARAI